MCVALPSTLPVLASGRYLWRPGWRHSLSHRIEKENYSLGSDWWPGPRDRWWSALARLSRTAITPKPRDFRIRDACFQGLLRHTLLSMKLCMPQFQHEILISFGWLVFCVIWQPAYLYRSTEMKLSFPSRKKTVLKRLFSTTGLVFSFYVWNEHVSYNLWWFPTLPALRITWGA